MATYTELRNLFSNGTLRNRVVVATVIAANNLLAGSPTADDRKWASSVFGNPRNEGEKAFMSVIAVNKDATIAAIEGATDAAIQTNVDAVVPDLVAAHAAAV